MKWKNGYPFTFTKMKVKTVFFSREFTVSIISGVSMMYTVCDLAVYDHNSYKTFSNFTLITSNTQ